MKKILFIVHRIPYPPNKGDKIRSFNELKYLAQRHSVDLLCLADEPEDLKYKVDLEKLCDQVEVFPLNPQIAKIRGGIALLQGRALSSRYFYNKAMQKTFDAWLQTKEYDSIFCFSSSMAEYIFQSKTLSQLESVKQPQLVMDFCDVDSDKWQQYAGDSSFPLNKLYSLEYRRLLKYEQRIQNYFNHTVLVSTGEAELFYTHCPECKNLTVIPNGVDHQYFSPTFADSTVEPVAKRNSPSIVFTGAMDYPVNIKGVLWFVEEVWPHLQQRYPELLFYIVGSHPAAEIVALKERTNIIVTGFVEDIRAYYKLADVCVAPLHQGRGVQNKVLEAMSMGKPVVATSKANAGVQAASDDHLLIADTAKDFTAMICRLLDDSQLASNIGRAARDYVVSRFDWETNILALEELLLSPEKDCQKVRVEGAHD